MLLAVCAMAIMMSCNKKGQTAGAAAPGDSTVTDSVVVEKKAIDLEGIAKAIEDEEIVKGHILRNEKRILALRFYDGRTQMEVASLVGISQAQVSRLEKNAIRRIKKELGS